MCRAFRPRPSCTCSPSTATSEVVRGDVRPDAVLNWLEDIVDVIKEGGEAERNPDLRAMRIQGEQAKALIERLHANAAA